MKEIGVKGVHLSSHQWLQEAEGGDHHVEGSQDRAELSRRAGAHAPCVNLTERRGRERHRKWGAAAQ